MKRRRANSTVDQTTGQGSPGNWGTPGNASDPDMTPDNATAASNKLLSLGTTFNGTYTSNGAMFDVSTRVIDRVVKIVSLDIHTSIVQDDCPVMVLGRPGTHVGFENVTKGWSLLVNATVKCAGFGERTVIPSSLFRKNPTLRSGESYAFYTLMATPSLRYSDGNAVGQIYSSSTFLSIHEGTGVGGFFGGESQAFETPRVWNGVVKYQVADDDQAIPRDASASCETHLATSYDDDLGSFGNMFDVVTHNSSILIHGVDIYTDVKSSVTYEIYTRVGTYKDGMRLPRKSNSTANADERALSVGNATNVQNMLSLNWTLVQRGNVIGRGSGRGTPIRDFIPFTIPPASRHAFYVTLTTPDLRYQDIERVAPDLIVGDTYYDNDDMDILVGVSVGTYPATSVYFGPRLWSGALLYNASRECPSEAPSQMPSLPPSIPPSQEPTSSPSIGVLPDFGNCTDLATLETALDGGTESYGTMFTVTSSAHVNITSIDIHVATTDEVYVEVYTKIGDYRGFEEDPSSWRAVAAVNVVGAGEGKLTSIPDADFEDVTMAANETRAYYVTTSTAYLKYSRSSVQVGKAQIADDYITINSGAGLAAPDFGGSAHSPRSFNGALHYLHNDDCNDNLFTSVGFIFNIQRLGSATESEIGDAVNENVLGTVKDIMTMDSTLRAFTSENGLELTNSTTLPSQLTTCNALSADGMCMPLETKVLFSHNTTLDPGKLLDTMLKYRDTIERNLNLAGIQAAYDGDIPVQSEIIVSLQGNFTTGLSDSELKYFQAIARAYLKAKLADIGVDILDVQARHPAHARFLQRSDDDGTGSSNSIDVTTIVDGAYRPPPEIDFGGEVDDALGADGGKEFRDDLVSGRRDIPEDIVKNAGALKTVTAVESKVVTQNSIAPVRETSSGNSSTAILGGVLGFLVVAFLVTLWYYRRRRKEGKKSAHVVSVGGIRSYLKFGKLNHTSPSELLDENALEAECTFIDDDPYMKEHLVHKHHLSGRYGDGTASTFENSAELRTDWTQGPFPTSEDGIQRYASIQSLPANGVSNDSDLSPHPRGNFPKSRGEYDQSAESRRPQPEMSLTGTRSQRSMGMGGRNDDSLDFNNVLEKSMSYGASMTAFNRSMGNVNSAPSMGHHEKSMASIGNGGRRSMPRSTSVNRSVGAVEPGSTMASFPTVPITDPVLREMSMTSFGSDGRSPGAPRSAFNRSMSNLGSAGRMHFPIAPVMGDTGPNQSTTSIGIGSRSPMPPRAAFETSDSMAKVESDGGGELLPRTNFDRSTGSLYNNGRMQSTMVPPINRRSLMKNETNPIAPSMALERSRSAGQGIARDRLDRRSASGRF